MIIEFVGSLSDIPKEDWEKIRLNEYPFLKYDFSKPWKIQSVYLLKVDGLLPIIGKKKIKLLARCQCILKQILASLFSIVLGGCIL